MTTTAHAVLERLVRREDLSADDTYALFRTIVRGEVETPLLAGILVALRSKGETVHELSGAASALGDSAVPIARTASPVADTCGTGGDGARTLNVSTAAALVCAAAGLPVAKHGNRAVSSSAGSANVLEALGAEIDVSPEVAGRALAESGFCFLFAPRMQPGIAHAMPARRALQLRTIFNLLGPLVNPARPEVQLLGVADPRHVMPMAHVLRELGCRAALVVHGDGHDEIALHGTTVAAHLHEGDVEALELTPALADVTPHERGALVGGDAAFNAHALAALLSGRGRPAFVEATVLNAGALLWIAGRADDLRAGVKRARAALDQGDAALVLDGYKEVTRASRP